MTTLICFGDSITRGEYDSQHGGWVDRLKASAFEQYQDSESEEICVFNLGIGGETTDGLIHRFNHELAPRIDSDGRTFVTLAYGANDLSTIDGQPLTPVERYLENLSRCIQYATRRNLTLVLINILPIADHINRQPNPAGKCRTHVDIALYNRHLATLSHETGTPLLDVHEQFTSPDVLLTDDGVHPNASGHELMAQFIRDRLRMLGIAFSA